MTIERVLPLMDKAGVDRVIIVPPTLITHFTETLDFLSEEDKNWVMGRSIIERLKWS